MPLAATGAAFAVWRKELCRLRRTSAHWRLLVERRITCVVKVVLEPGSSLIYQLLQSLEDLAGAEFSFSFDVAIPCHCTRVLRISIHIFHPPTRLLWQEPSLLWQVELWLGDRRRQGHGNAAPCGGKLALQIKLWRFDRASLDLILCDFVEHKKPGEMYRRNFAWNHSIL